MTATTTASNGATASNDSNERVPIMTITVNGVKLSSATVSYLETALWSSTVSRSDDDYDGEWDFDGSEDIADGDPMDDHFDLFDISESTLREAEADIDAFFDYLEELDLLDRAREYADDEQIAHDFWLTRNGHGAGFWDGDYDDRNDPEASIGDALTDAAKSYGGVDLYVGDDGVVYSL